MKAKEFSNLYWWISLFTVLEYIAILSINTFLSGIIIENWFEFKFKFYIFQDSQMMIIY